MSNNKRLIFAILSLFLISCDANALSENNDSSLKESSENNSSEIVSFENPNWLNLTEYKDYVTLDLRNYMNSIMTSLDANTVEKINHLTNEFEINLRNLPNVKVIMESYDELKKKISSEIPVANGIYSFEDNIDLIGILECYAERNYLTGFNIYEKDGYNFALNVNSMDQSSWNNQFGLLDQNNYWEVEPALNNEHFLKALSLSIDRKEFAYLNGAKPKISYLDSSDLKHLFGENDYENSIYHRNAINSKIKDTDGYGYNLELARTYFKIALSELEAESIYKPGSIENPTIIELEIAWDNKGNEEKYHNDIKQYFENAFNDISVCGGLYKLVIKSWSSEIWSDIYSKKYYNGNFDLGFGNISSSTNDPYRLLNRLSSSDQFCLNFGLDTNSIAEDYVIYNGVKWSYDALLNSLQNNTIVVDSLNNNHFIVTKETLKLNDDGSYSVDLLLDFVDEYKLNIDDIVMFYFDNKEYYENSVLSNSKVEINENNNCLSIQLNISNGLVPQSKEYFGLDVHYKISDQKSTYSSIYTILDK